MRFPLLALALLLTASCAQNGRPQPPPGPAVGSPGATPAEQAATLHGGNPRSSEAVPEHADTAVYGVRGSGVRCAAAPCPFYLAEREGAAEGSEPLRVHELDVSALGLSEESQAALLERATAGRIRVEGTVSVRPNAGPAGDATVLHVSRVLDGV